MDFSYIARIFPALMQGAGTTLLLFALVFPFSLPLGFLITLCANCRFRPVKWIAQAYIFVMRGTPLMLQLFFFYFGLPFIEPQPVVQGTVSTSGSPLRLRAYPSAAGQTIALMPNGASVTVYGTWQGWNTVEYNGNLGYAAEAYIES